MKRFTNYALLPRIAGLFRIIARCDEADPETGVRHHDEVAG